MGKAGGQILPLDHGQTLMVEDVPCPAWPNMAIFGSIGRFFSGSERPSVCAVGPKLGSWCDRPP